MSEPSTSTLSREPTASELYRSIDWGATPLGPSERWSPSLRTAAELVMANRFPMALWWGAELVNLYNDAYRQIMADKHPRAMGRSGREVWSEIWPQIGPQVEAVFRGEGATWNEHLLLPMNRRGFSEETYFTFSYSPVEGEAPGRVGGMLITCQETTQSVQGERQLVLLRALAEHAIASADGPTATTGTLDDAIVAAARAFGTNPRDLPFAIVYLHGGRHAHAGLHGDADALVAMLGAPHAFDEPFAVPEDGAISPSFLGDPVRRAIAIALERPHKRFGHVVFGISPHRTLDEPYRRLFSLVANQVTSVLSYASAFEEQHQRNEELASLDRAKTEFFSNVSHEFRTPLTLMLGPTESALRAPVPRLEGEDLALLHRNQLRLLKLVNTLLDFARIEAGRARATFVETDIVALTRDLASSFQQAIHAAGLTFQIHASPIERPVFVDHDLWEKVVLNLLSNALKHTFAGGIALHLHADRDQLELVVSDTGVGIPADALPRIFERFHRLTETRARTHEGSGIGLALVHEIVRMHGGRIDVRSEVGKGTSFTVHIPTGCVHLPREQIGAPTATSSTALGVAPYVQEALRWLPDDQSGEPRADDVELGTEVVGGPARDARVLVADDNADMREYLGRLLGQRWRVELAVDGAQALELARRDPPDLVLSDVMMPNLDGFGLLRELRRDTRTRAVPVILLSARAGEDARIEGLERGADDYLVKPFSARELVARVAAQIQIARLRAAADAERDRFAQIFVQSPVPIALFTGREHRYVFASPSYLEMTGRGSDIVGKPIHEVFPELGPGHPALEPLDRAYATGNTVRVEETHAPLRDGNGALEDRWFTYVVHPFRDSRGAITGLLNMAVDVTSLKAARRALEASHRAAEEANRVKDDFLAMLGHELRNPISPIVTAIQLLKLRGQGSTTRELDVIERQAEHLTRLVDDLLDVSRITRGKIDLRMDTLEVSDVIAAAIETSSPTIQSGRHRLIIDVPRRGLTVNGDRVRLAQVIANLLTNAAKYTPPGGRIAVSAERQGDEVVIAIEDNGSGISPDLLPHVFDLFVQARQTLARSQGGLGLGLGIVKSLVTMHGGSVSAESAGPGRGSRFVVRLPRAHLHAASTPPPPPHAQPDPPHPQLRILVVDDNVDGAELMAASLEIMGYGTAVAHDGPEALTVASAYDPHIVLLDIGLPTLDGYEVASRLHDERPGTFLVAVTGYGQEADRERARRVGFHEHLTKPVDIERLGKTITKLSAKMN